MSAFSPPNSAQEAQAQLYQACKTADSTRVRELIQAGADINRMVGPIDDLNYCLTIAADTKSETFVRFLMENGACPQSSAIKAAASNGEAHVLRLLLQPVKAEIIKNTERLLSNKAINLDSARQLSKDRWRHSLTGALKLAVTKGRVETAKELIIFREKIPHAVLEKAIRAGFVAAVERDHRDSIFTFLAWGARELPDVLEILATHEKFDLLQTLIKAEDYQPSALGRALWPLAKSGNLTVLNFLLDKGAEDGGNALLMAARHSQLSTAVQLLQSFTYSTSLLSDAVEAAAAKGDVEMMCLLFRYNALPRDALNVAVGFDRVEATEILLQKYEYTKAQLTEALVGGMIAWGKRQERNQTVVLSEQGEESKQARVISYEPRSTEILRYKHARLPGDHYLQILEAMIFLGNEYGAKLLLKRPQEYTDNELPNTHLLALSIYHGRKELIPLLLHKYDIFCHADANPAQNGNPDDGSTKAIYQQRANQSRSKPYPTPLLAAVMRQDFTMSKRLLRITDFELSIWCDYRPGNVPCGYYTNSTEFGNLRNLFGEEKFHHNPLSKAVELGDTALTRLLLRNNADPWSGRADVSIFKMAAERGKLRDLITWSAEDAEKNINRHEHFVNRNIIDWAVEYGEQHDPDLLTELLSQGGDVNNHAGHNGITFLHRAIEAGSLRTVKQLCWAGARLTAVQNSALEGRGAGELFSGTTVEYAAWVASKEAEAEAEARKTETNPDAAATMEEALMEKQQQRHAIVDFLEKWQSTGMQSMDAASVRQKYDEDLATAAAASAIASAKARRLMGKREAKDDDKGDEGDQGDVDGDDVISHFDDEESLHLSDDEDDSNNNNKDDDDDDDDDDYEEDQAEEDQAECSSSEGGWEMIDKNLEEL